MGKIERKNSWQLSEGLGKTTPYQLQRLLDPSVWDEERCRDFIQDYSIKHLGPSGTCIFDDTGFLKKGNKSASVQPIYGNSWPCRELSNWCLCSLENPSWSYSY